MIIREQHKPYSKQELAVFDLLDVFQSLRKEQIEVYLLQSNLCSRKNEAIKIIQALISDEEIIESNGFLSNEKDIEHSEGMCNSFWVFLQYVNGSVLYDAGRDPVDIVLISDNKMYQIISIFEANLVAKMEFVKERKPPLMPCEVIFVLPENGLSEIDESMYPDESFGIASLLFSKDNPIPKFNIHKINNKEGK